VSARPSWKPSFLGALWGVIVGSLASGSFMGAVVVLVHVASGEPVPDAIFTALRPLGYFSLVPIVMAVGIDVVCRREAFWLATGRRPAVELTIITSLIAPSSAVWIDWPDGGTIFWVLAASTVILRLGTVPASAAPKWFLLRSRTERAVVVIAALTIAAGGVLAYQIARPGLAVTSSGPGIAAAVRLEPGGPRNAYMFQLDNRILSDVTVLGLEGWGAGEMMHLERDSARPPFVVGSGVSTGVFLVVDSPGCSGSGHLSALHVRYRALGVERRSYINLPRAIHWGCPTPKG
jgi:hypothetical protein